MKKSILTLAVSALIVGSALTSCNSPETKIENAETKVTVASENLDEANKEYLIEVVKFKEEKVEGIIANEKSIAEFKARIEKEKKGAKVDYLNKIKELEKKNTDMRYKMDNYKEEGKEKWVLFRDEFTHDMLELGKALNDLATDNIK